MKLSSTLEVVHLTIYSSFITTGLNYEHSVKITCNPIHYIPRDQLDKVVIRNSSLGIKNTQPAKGQFIVQFTCRIDKALI